MKTNADRDLIGVAVDNVVFNLATKAVSVLLIKRKNPPFEGQWALPGGFVDYTDPTLRAAAARELVEETQLVVPCENLLQVHTTDNLQRDPRGPIVTIVYGVIDYFDQEIMGQDDAAEAQWHSVFYLDDVELAFDHRDLVRIAQEIKHWSPMYRRCLASR